MELNLKAYNNQSKMENNNHTCIVCNCIIPEARVEFLIENNKELTCIKHTLTKPPKAIYTGEHGTSDLIICDRVYDDSVRNKFYDAETIDVICEEEAEEIDTETHE